MDTVREFMSEHETDLLDQLWFKSLDWAHLCLNKLDWRDRYISNNTWYGLCVHCAFCKFGARISFPDWSLFLLYAQCINQGYSSAVTCSCIKTVSRKWSLATRQTDTAKIAIYSKREAYKKRINRISVAKIELGAAKQELNQCLYKYRQELSLSARWSVNSCIPTVGTRIKSF